MALTISGDFLKDSAANCLQNTFQPNLTVSVSAVGTLYSEGVCLYCPKDLIVRIGNKSFHSWSMRSHSD